LTRLYLETEEWNPTLFDQAKEGASGWEWDNWLFRVDKQANRLYGGARENLKENFPNIEECIENIPQSLQRIFLKFPFMPNASDYNNMTESDPNYILVYMSNKWEMKLKSEFK
jgi:hypothetical protein